MKGLTALQTLDVLRSKVERLEPVRDLPNLREFDGGPAAEKEKLDAYRKKNGPPFVSAAI